MAPRYSNKKAKYTYSERVLGALSEIQKDHRKHAVHMATLRAQVRKTADARKDRMGPLWSQWVSRTVQKLADDGILDTSDPHGNVTFTPDAKKTIATVRRESLGPGVAPSLNIEHRIWKDVTRRFSVVGVKRNRRRSSAIGAADDEEEARPRKRQARKSFSSLTKSELENELRAALQRLQEAEEPILDDELEIADLREELKSREQEVVELRDEVARLKDQHADQRRVTFGAMDRLLTPAPTNPSENSTPTHPATTSRPRVASRGMTRTLSGTLISSLTRRPTPEPSDSGSHDNGIEDMIYDEAQSRPSSPAYPTCAQAFPDPSPEFGLGTPRGSSPILDDWVENETAPRQSCDDNSSEVASLKDELEVKNSQLNQLRAQYESLLLEKDELRASVASRDGRLEGLEVDLQTRVMELSASESRRVQLEDSLRTEASRLKEAEASLRTSWDALAEERRRYSALEEKHHNLQNVVKNLQGKVEHLTLHGNSLQSIIDETCCEAAHLREAHLESEGNLETLKNEVACLQEELGVVRDSSQSLQDALKSSEEQNDLLGVDLKQTKAELTSTLEALAEARCLLDSDNVVRASMLVQIQDLETELTASKDHVTLLSASKNELERTVHDLETTVEQLHKDVSHAKAQLASASAQVLQSEGVIDDLRTSNARSLSELSASVREAAALKVTVSEYELTLDTLRSQLADAAAETAGIQQELETEQISRRRAESELVATKEERDGLFADITDKTAELATTTEQLERGKQAVDDALRRIEGLDAQRERDANFHLAEKSALESSLETTRAEVADMKCQGRAHQDELSKLSGELRAALAERDNLSAVLKDEVVRVTALKEELSVALEDVRDAEEEIEELRQAKASDEASIETMKGLMARWTQIHIDAMNEVGTKLESARTAPTPGHRRRSSFAPRATVGKLA